MAQCVNDTKYIPSTLSTQAHTGGICVPSNDRHAAGDIKNVPLLISGSQMAEMSFKDC